MKSLLTYASLLLLSIGVASCTGNDLDAKKAELEGLKSQLSEITTQIKALEAELIAADPAFAAAAKKSLLITTVAATKGDFTHFVEVTGSVLSKKNVNISAETGGRILDIPAIEGMRMSKGQVLAKIDSESIQRSIEELENNLSLADRFWKAGAPLETKNRYRNPVLGGEKSKRGIGKKSSFFANSNG